MSTKLTSRDKVLIYVMAIVLLIFGFVWLIILPQFNLSSQLDLEISELETKKMPIELAVMGLPEMEKNMEEAGANFKKAVSGFYPYMETYEIDRMITNTIISKYGLTVDSLSLNPVPELVMVPFYAQSTSNPAKSVEDIVNESNQTPTEEDEEMAESKIPLNTSRVTIITTGAREKMLDLLDALFTEYPSIRVTNYTISDNQGKQVLNLVCEVYMQLPD